MNGSTPPTVPDQAEEAAPEDANTSLLLQFLATNDATCPVCGYNVRGLKRAVCPECHHALELTVGTPRVPLAWFVIAIAPGIFSGIAALFMAIPVVMVPLTGNGFVPIPIMATDAFGFLSGLTAIFLVVKRWQFLALQSATQYKIAILIWTIHLIAFLAFFGFMIGWY